jgi:hypothetical protein
LLLRDPSLARFLYLIFNSRNLSFPSRFLIHLSQALLLGGTRGCLNIRG